MPALQALSAQQVNELASKLPARTAVAGEVIVRAGDRAAHLVIVEWGKVAAVQYTRAGTRVQLASVAGPCLIDKVATLLGERHTADWTVTVASRFRLMPEQMLWDLIATEPRFAAHVIRRLAAEVNTDRRALVRRSSGSPVAQVASWLAETSRAADGLAIPLPRSQEGLGEELGLSRVTINRALRRLKLDGMIDVRRRNVVIIDPDGLLALASADS